MCSRTAWNPSSHRYVSCWPAKDASGRSSAVAEERTATGAGAVEARHQSLVGEHGQFAQVRRHRAGAHVVPDLGGHQIDLAGRLRDRAPPEARSMRSPMPVRCHEGVEQCGGHHEPGRHRHAGGRHGDQGCALAAECFEPGLDAAVEELDVLSCCPCLRPPSVTGTASGDAEGKVFAERDAVWISRVAGWVPAG